MIDRTQEDVMQRWPKEWDTPLVSIRCLAYNQEQYIVQTLEGFLMQETEYPFEIVIHDDASTDKTTDIIREYEQRFPKIIKPIYETENRYSKHDGSLSRMMRDACHGKYIAFCEGDDYWIDPSKLQTQVKWMEEHPEYTMCCSNANVVSSREIDWTRYPKDCDIPLADMVLCGGAWVVTCTTLYRRNIVEEYSRLDFCLQCHVGDYCCQILSALLGKVRYFNTRMAAYRYLAVGSWSSKNTGFDYNKKLKGWRSEIDMLKGFDAYSEYKYHDLFEKKMSFDVYVNSVIAGDGFRPAKDVKAILSNFEDVKGFSLSQKIKIFLITHHLSFLFQIKRGLAGKNKEQPK